MKTSKILVGNGASLSLSTGNGIAVYPIQKGGEYSFILLDNGKVARLKGSRFEGVGIVRYLTDRGFSLAQPGDAQAAKLADYVDCWEGTELVEKAASEYANALQKTYGGQTCTFVPFNEEKAVRSVDIEPSGGFVSMMFDLQTGFNSAMVRSKFDIACAGELSSLALSAGWIVGPEGDATKVPRNTEYGGLVEQAVFTICNSGLGTLVGKQNLEMDANAAVDDPYPRGRLEVALKSDDRLVVGVTYDDMLEVSYLRAGAVLYSRKDVVRQRLGEVIGSFAAVIVRVAELDAVPVKKSRAKAA